MRGALWQHRSHHAVRKRTAQHTPFASPPQAIYLFVTLNSRPASPPHHSFHPPPSYNASGSLRSRQWYPPVPASRHWELFSDARLPRPPSFNDADLDGKPAWMRDLLL